MEALIEQIQLALATEATPEARSAGASACRTILTALGATGGEPLVVTPSPTTGTVQGPLSPATIQAAVTALRTVPVEHLLDFAIARLRTVVPGEVATPTSSGLKFQLVHVPQGR